jgi:hypothetical protein
VNCVCYIEKRKKKKRKKKNSISGREVPSWQDVRIALNDTSKEKKKKKKKKRKRELK